VLIRADLDRTWHLGDTCAACPVAIPQAATVPEPPAPRGHTARDSSAADLVLWAKAETEETLTGSFRRIWGHLNGHTHDSPPSASTSYLREQVHELLAALPGRWLLVFDDATPDGVDAWIPRLGRGNVLFTSIDSAGWHTLPRVALSRMNHAQALELLTRRLHLDEKMAATWREDLDALAEALEGWPLAIELACGYMRTCQIPVERLEQFRTLLFDRALADKRSKPSGYPRTLAATVELSLERLAHNTADDGELPNQVREVLGFLCNFAAQRIPVHLAMACAFIPPDIVPVGKEAVVLDEATVPVREIIRALIQVSFLRYDEPLASRFSEFAGSDDTVSMNTVLQHLLRQHLTRGAQVDTALSRSAFHTARWLSAALDFGDGDVAGENSVCRRGAETGAVRTEVVAARTAGRAGAAADGGFDRDRCAGLDAGPGPGRRDDTGGLVAKDGRPAEHVLPVAAAREVVHVGTADAHGVDLDEHLVGAEGAQGHLFDAEVVGAVQYGGSGRGGRGGN
jgi:hypothetical protein